MDGLILASIHPSILKSFFQNFWRNFPISLTFPPKSQNLGSKPEDKSDFECKF
jgi:hypothetical protein